jgi:hypothetical protein
LSELIEIRPLMLPEPLSVSENYGNDTRTHRMHGLETSTAVILSLLLNYRFESRKFPAISASTPEQK